MSLAELQVKRWGNSLGIIIPKDIVRQEKLEEGISVKIDITKNKRIDGFGLFKGGPRFKEEDLVHEDF